MKKYLIPLLILCFSGLFSNISLAHGHIHYIENKGQWNNKVLFQAKIPSGELYLEKNFLTFHLWDSKKVSDLFHGTLKDKSDTFIQSHAYQIQFVGANPNPVIERQEVIDEYFNYYIGKDKSKWASGCLGFESIVYKELYPKIDFKIYALGNNIKYDFIVHPGGNIKDIRLKYAGIDQMEILANQDLYVHNAVAITKELKPYSYYKENKQLRTVPSKYVLNQNTVSFDVESTTINQTKYDLIIDPVVIFSIFSGSVSDNFGSTATYDDAGNLYGAGTVFGPNYPTTLGAYKTAASVNIGFNNPDMGITKFSANGSTRIFSTFLGGNGCDQPHSLICDKNDRLLVYGTTSSANYPVTPGAFDTSFNGGASFAVNGLGLLYTNGADMVITKFNQAGTALIGSTYLGGSGTDGVNMSISLSHNYGDQIRGEVLLDTSDNVYVVSTTTSTDFPTTLGSYDQSANGGYDGCITRLNSTLTNLLFSTYFGGNGDDAIYSIALDRNDLPVIAGGTTSTNFPVTSNAFDQTFNGIVDGFVSKLKSTGDSLISSTYYGSPQYDQIYFVELTRKDTIFVFGQTKNTTNYFISNATFSQPNSGQFISKFTNLPNSRLMSTTIGRQDGDPDISPTAFLVDFCGKIYIAGWGSGLGGLSQSPLTVSGLPTTPGAFQTTTTGNDLYLMVLDDNASKLDYASFFGGNNSQEHVDGGTSRFDKNGIMYHAVCAGCGGNSDFPIRPIGGPVVSATNNSPNCNLGVFKFDFGLPVKADFSANTGCAPATISFTNLSHTVDTNATYVWNFGDGSPVSNAKNPTHLYTLPGLYTVRLILLDTLSCNSRDTAYKNVLVLQNGKNTFLPDKVICPGGTVRIGLDNVKDPNITFRWSPVTGLDDTTILTPYATPSVTTTYKLYISKNGCTDTFTQRVVIKAPDNIKITGDTLVCQNFNTTLTATLFSKATYQWLPASLIVSNSGNIATVNVSANNTKINLLYRDSLGCLQRDSITIMILNPLIKLNADTLMCKDANVTITCITNLPEVTYQWKPASLLVSNLGFQAVFKVDTVRYFYLDAIDNSGCIVRDSIRINTIQNIFKINADTLVCKGDTITLNSTGNAQWTYQWSPSGKIVSGGNTTNPRVLVDGDNWYKVLITDNSGCTGTDSIRIRVINNVFKINADTAVCPKDTVQISATVNSQFTYQWLPPSQIVSGGNTAFPKAYIPQTSYIKVLVTDNSGCIYRDSILIKTINYNFKISGDSIVCINDTVTLTSTLNPLLTLSWRPVSKILSGANTNQIRAKMDTTTTFYVDMQDVKGCKLIDSFRVITLENSFRINTLDTLLCFGDTFTINAPADKDLVYLWGPSANVLSGANTNNPRIVINGVKQLYFIVTDTSGCSARDTFNFTPIQNIFSVVIDSTKCAGDTIKPIATLNPQFTYRWFPTAAVLSGGNTNVPLMQLTASQKIWVEVTDNSGCKVYDSVSMSIRSRKIDFGADTFICPNDTIQITANVYTGATYSWTPLNKIISGANTFNPIVTTNKDARFTVIISDTTYCSITDSVLVKVLNNENFNFVNQDTSWCKGDTIRLHVTEVSGVTYNWNPPGVIVKDFNTANPLAVIKGRTRIEVAIRDNKKGCVAADTIYINVNNDSVKIRANQNLCVADTTTLYANEVKNALYEWTPGWLINRDTMVNYYQTSDMTYKVKLTILPDRECVYEDSIRVFIRNELIDLEATASPSIINPGDTVQLDAKTLKGVSFEWDVDKTISNRFIRNPKAMPDTTKIYFVTVSDLYNCKKRASVKVEINYEICDEPEVFIPNIFSPNGDGKNDVFIVRGDNIMEASMIVYDRWGQKMFESNDKNVGWDGTFGGTLLEPSVFAYFVQVRCIGGKTFKKQGNVTLVK